MPRNNGIFTLTPIYRAVPGTPIRAEQHNGPLEDVAAALTNSLPRDGSAPMQGALPMGGFRITGLAAAVNDGDAVRKDQVVGSAFLSSIAQLTMGANEYVYASGVNVAARGVITPFARAILDDASAADARNTLGIPPLDQATWNAGASTQETIISPAKILARIVAWANANILGRGQTWVDVLSSRLADTVYQNTSGRPIVVFIQGRGARELQVSADGVTWINVGGFASDANPWIANTTIVPPQHYYRINGAMTAIGSWSELR